MTPVRLKPAAPRSRVKHSTTEPLHSLHYIDPSDQVTKVMMCIYTEISIHVVILCHIIITYMFYSYCEYHDY